MKLKHLATGIIYNDTDYFDEWPDRSKRTAIENYKLYPIGWQAIEETSPSSKAEIYDLACRIALSFAQAGINFDPKTCIDKAKELYKLKEGI